MHPNRKHEIAGIIPLFEGWEKEIKKKEGNIGELPCFNQNKFKKYRTDEKDKAKAVEEKIILLHNTLKDQYNKIQKYRYIKIIEMLEKAREEYELYKRENNLCSFTDLLLKSRDMLKDNLIVREYFKIRYKSYYVDEFQDTDPVQAEILFYLTGETDEENGTTCDWKSLKPRAGSLMVVGDPKQAIYRFRRADITVYNTVRDLIQKYGGELVTLNTNFRSVESICNSVNDAFGSEEKGLMYSKDENPYQPQYISMEAYYEGKPEKQLFYYEVEGTTKDALISNDAITVANKIEDLINKQHEKAEDIMIITPLAKGTAIYADELIKREISVSYTGSIILNINKEVRKLISVLKVIDNPYDMLNLTSAMENIFDICPADLYRYKKAKGRISIFIEESDGIQTNSSIEKALCKLKHYYFLKREKNPVALAEYIVEDLGLLNEAHSKNDGKRAFSQLLQLLESARDINNNNKTRGFSQYVQNIEKIASKEYKNQMSIALEEKSVRVMNLHQAKGLQAKIVFLANPYEFGGERKIQSYIERAGDGSQPVGYFNVVKNDGHKDSLLIGVSDWENKFDIEKNFLDAERIRLLYVAATRAKEILYISEQKNTTNSKGEVKKPAQNYWRELINALKCEALDMASWISQASDEAAAACESSPEDKESIEQNKGKAVETKESNTDEVLEEKNKNLSSGEKDTVIEAGGRKCNAFKAFEDSWRIKITKPTNILITPSTLEKGKRNPNYEVPTYAINDYEPPNDEYNINQDDYEEISDDKIDDNKEINESYEDKPRGPVWGTFIHRVFELIIRDVAISHKAPEPSSLEMHIKNAIIEVLRSEDISSKGFKLFFDKSLLDSEDIIGSAKEIYEANKCEIDGHIQRLLKSDLFAQIESAEVTMPEMPFWLTIDPKQATMQEMKVYDHVVNHLKESKKHSDVTIIVSGIMDLVFKIGVKWAIIDYKTNLPPKDKDIAVVLVDKYRSQLLAYKYIFEFMTGEAVDYICLYSTVTGKTIDIDI